MHKRLQLTLISGLASLSLVGCAGMSKTSKAPVPPPAPVVEAPKPADAEKDKVRPSTSGLVQSMIERRQSMTATGYAVISVQNHRLPAQQRLLAIRASKLDAYRALTEPVQFTEADGSAVKAGQTTTSNSLMEPSSRFRSATRSRDSATVLLHFQFPAMISLRSFSMPK